MNTLYLVSDETQLQAYHTLYRLMAPKLLPYMEHLQKTYAAQDFPRTLILTDIHTATCGISSIPVPAYTNDFRIVFTPDLSAWQDIYLRQLEPYAADQTQPLRTYYNTYFTENHLMQILGHELAHHSELFLTDDDYDTGIWFEEGMAEYISRAYFLTPDQFAAERRANQQLVDLFQSTYGWHSLEDFGQKTYDGNYASIFYEYWRSFLAVDSLVQRLGSVQAVFAAYKSWHDTCPTQPLTDWFHITL